MRNVGFCVWVINKKIWEHCVNRELAKQTALMAATYEKVTKQKGLQARIRKNVDQFTAKRVGPGACSTGKVQFQLPKVPFPGFLSQSGNFLPVPFSLEEVLQICELFRQSQCPFCNECAARQKNLTEKQNCTNRPGKSNYGLHALGDNVMAWPRSGDYTSWEFKHWRRWGQGRCVAKNGSVPYYGIDRWYYRFSLSRFLDRFALWTDLVIYETRE